MWRQTWAQVDLQRLAHNVHALKSCLAQNVRLMATVKANGYGHGAVEIAKAALAAGADQLGVATLEEAIQLRQAQIEAPILMYGAMPMHGAEAIVQYGIMATIAEATELQEMTKVAQKVGKFGYVHVKMDTGMGRLGLRSPEDVRDLIKQVAGTAGMVLEGVFTHLACADDSPGSSGELYTDQQRLRFEQMLAYVRADGIKIKTVHAANSSAMLRDKRYHYDMVRPGLAMYGYHPAPDWMEAIDLLPVLSLRTRVVRVVDLPAGEGVSYGCTYITQGPETIATVPVGYADGIPRGLSNIGRVCVHGHPATIVGRVCMDQMMIKVTGIPVQVGDVVEIYGGGRGSCSSLEDAADQLDTVPYELLCRLSDRVTRVYL